MSQQRKQYSREFKVETLELCQTSDKSDAEIERDLGLPAGALYRWKKQLAKDGAQAFPGNGRLKADEALIRQLQRENQVLRQEREILKKVLAIFSEEHR